MSETFVERWRRGAEESGRLEQVRETFRQVRRGRLSEKEALSSGRADSTMSPVQGEREESMNLMVVGNPFLGTGEGRKRTPIVTYWG